MSEHTNGNNFTENGPETDDDGPEIYSVGEISTLIRQTLEDEFPYVRIRGEISGFTRAASGHLYFSLKDDKDVIDAVCWRGSAAKLQTKPEDGLEIIATGRLTSYGPRSRYQIVVERVEVAGEGALLKLLEDRKKKLAHEGLFDEDRKKELPYLPLVIGVVTSPTGAVIRDILHRLEDRFPVHVIVWPVKVQGNGAAAEISAAINGFDKISHGGKVPGQIPGQIPRPDLIIVARGGGSIEDLWAFNEENVVRATADCTIPIISAVGHETDTTLIDYASDLRAPTPSAAAEMAVPVKADLLAGLMDEASRLLRVAPRITLARKTGLDGLARGLPDLAHMVGTVSQRLDDWNARLGGSLKSGVERRLRRVAQSASGLTSPAQRISFAGQGLGRSAANLIRGMGLGLGARRNRLSQTERLLEGFSYQRVLDRGFVLLQTPDGKTITRAASLKAGDDVNLQMADGRLGARITGKENKNLKPKPKKQDLRQGKLL